MSRFTSKIMRMPGKITDSEILTIRQVADYLKVNERTIYRLAAAKRIPAFKVGGTWRFSTSDIDQWIQRQSASGHAIANTKDGGGDDATE